MSVNVYLLQHLNEIIEKMDETLSSYPLIIGTCRDRSEEKVINEAYEDLKRARYQMDIAINKSIRCQKCGKKIGAKKYFRYLSICGDTNSNYPVCDKCLAEIVIFAGMPFHNDGLKE